MCVQATGMPTHVQAFQEVKAVHALDKIPVCVQAFQLSGLLEVLWPTTNLFITQGSVLMLNKCDVSPKPFMA